MSFFSKIGRADTWRKELRIYTGFLCVEEASYSFKVIFGLVLQKVVNGPALEQNAPRPSQGCFLALRGHHKKPFSFG
jgi:hypothetical protein